MRSMLIASLMLIPLALPPAAAASTPAIDASTSARSLRVSTGEIPVKVIDPGAINLPFSLAVNQLPANSAVVLNLNVDRNGQPRDVRVVRSTDPFLDQPVLSALRTFQFHPARLDGKPVSVPLRLTVVVRQ